MLKTVGVGVVALMIGALVGYGVTAHASPKATRGCSQSAVVSFMRAELGRGAVSLVPPGCTDALMIQIWLQAYRQNQQWQAINARLARLEGRVNQMCPVVAKLPASYLVC